MPRSSTFATGELTDTAVQVMLALAEPRHGYAVMQFLEQVSGGSITIGPASLYTTLRKLRDAGMIHELGADEARRTYELTASGRDALGASVEQRRSLVRLADQILTEGSPR